MIYKMFSILKVEKDDLRFFLPLGALAGILMEVTSLLPERVNRGFFSDIISDHLPWATIMLILIFQTIVVLFYHMIRRPRLKTYFHDLVEHASKKIKDFCSPAFSILLGVSIGCALYAFVTWNGDYLGYSIEFGYFSIFFIIIVFISEYLNRAINSTLSDTVKELFKVVGIAIIATVFISPFFNDDPIEVSFELSVEEYEELKNAAEIKNVSVTELIKHEVFKTSEVLIFKEDDDVLAQQVKK